jgi:hypothetical protein
VQCYVQCLSEEANLYFVRLLRSDPRRGDSEPEEPRDLQQANHDLQDAQTRYRREQRGGGDSEGNFMLELSSSNFVAPPYTDEQEGLLRGLGWRRPLDTNQPNFHKVIGSAEARPLTNQSSI